MSKTLCQMSQINIASPKSQTKFSDMAIFLVVTKKQNVTQIYHFKGKYKKYLTKKAYYYISVKRKKRFQSPPPPTILTVIFKRKNKAEKLILKIYNKQQKSKMKTQICNNVFEAHKKQSFVCVNKETKKGKK